MTEADPDAERPGERWLKAALVVGAGFPWVFGAFLGNIVEILGLPGANAPGLAYGFWAATFFFIFAGVIGVASFWIPYTLVGRGRAKAGGALAVLVGLAAVPLGLWSPVTGWWLAGPLAVVGGGLALAARGSPSGGSGGSEAEAAGAGGSE